MAEKNYIKANELLFVTEERFSNINGEIKYLKDCIVKHEKENTPALVINFE